MFPMGREAGERALTAGKANGCERELAGSAGVTPAYVGLEPTLILPIDPPRRVIVHRAVARRQSSARAAMTATPSASGSCMWNTPRASCAASVKADGMPGTAAIMPGRKSPASMTSAAGEASKIEVAARQPVGQADRLELQTDLERRGDAFPVGLGHQRPGATRRQTAHGGAPYRPEAEHEDFAALEPACGRLEGRHVAVGRRGIVVDRAALGDVECDEAVVVGEEQHLGAGGDRRLDAAHVRLRGRPRVAAEVLQRGHDTGGEARDDALAGGHGNGGHSRAVQLDAAVAVDHRSQRQVAQAQSGGLTHPVLDRVQLVRQSW